MGRPYQIQMASLLGDLLLIFATTHLLLLGFRFLFAVLDGGIKSHFSSCSALLDLKTAPPSIDHLACFCEKLVFHCEQMKS